VNTRSITRFSFTIFFTAGGLLTDGATPLMPDSGTNLDSLARVAQHAAASLTSPEIASRKEIRREFQQRGYANVLYEFEEGDGLSALMSYAKMTAHIEFVLPHNTLYAIIPIVQPPRRESHLPAAIYSPPSSPPLMVPLREDWTFPEDPWRKD
jgi:hypothetical protein